MKVELNNWPEPWPEIIIEAPPFDENHRRPKDPHDAKWFKRPEFGWDVTRFSEWEEVPFEAVPRDAFDYDYEPGWEPYRVVMVKRR